MARAHTTDLATLEPGFKLWLSSDKTQGAFGDGKWRLLKAIDQHGSLRLAAKSLNISYRKAWGDLKKAEEALGIRLVEKHRGGTQGGKTRLTPTGRKWLAAYAALRKELEQTVATHYSEFCNHLERQEGK